MPHVLLVIAATLLGFATAYALTGLVRTYAERTRMVDTPNDRTLHQGDIPRGGGLSIVVVMLICLALLGYVYPDVNVLPIMVITVVLGLMGWVDDRFVLGPLVKIGVQIIVAVYAVNAIGASRSVAVAGYELEFGSLGAFLSVMWIVWMTNAYNFMDGIDGIAASHTAIVACVMGVWFALDHNAALALFCYAIMAASLGFLIWNWTPARIFMGDVGSVTLGGVFAVLAIIGNVQDGVPLTAYIILFGVFLFDTIVTLIRRLIEGKVIWNPHREHFYQRAAATGLGHAFVTVSAILATLVLAALASLEKFQVAPAGLWPLLALFLLTTLASLVMVREKSRAGQP
jgi:Fuc2NAc and GlcNAc transferase